MSWIDQCIVSFQTAANSKKLKSQNESIDEIIEKMSLESKIPIEILKSWYRSSNKKENKSNHEKSTFEMPRLPESSACLKCGSNVVHKSKRTKLPYTMESMYYGLCSSCIYKINSIKRADKDATDKKSGLVTYCPFCDGKFYISKKRCFKMLTEMISMEINK